MPDAATRFFLHYGAVRYVLVASKAQRRPPEEARDANFNSQLIFCSISAISVRSSRFVVASPASAELLTR